MFIFFPLIAIIVAHNFALRGNETKIKCKLTNLNTPLFAPRSDLLIIEPSQSCILQ